MELDARLLNELHRAAAAGETASTLVRAIRSRLGLTAPGQGRFVVAQYLREAFNVPVSKLSDVGGWVGFSDGDGGVTDAELDSSLEPFLPHRLGTARRQEHVMTGDRIEPTPDELTAFDVADEAINAFENLLNARGIRIDGGSELEHGSLVLKQMLEHYRLALQGGDTPPWNELRDDLQVAVGILNIIQLVLDRSTDTKFEALIPHLRLLASGSVAQTVRTRATDQASNKLFELRLALACIPSSSELEMDDPIASSGGQNPDIIARMSDGQRWGFACKVMHGDAPGTLFDRVEEGVEQIQRSDADTGLVVVSFKNQVPHSELLPELGHDPSDGHVLGAHRSIEPLRGYLVGYVHRRVSEMQAHATQEKLADVLRGKKALPAIAVPVEVAAGFATERGPLISHFAFLQVVLVDWGVAKRFDRGAAQVTAEINNGLVPGRAQRAR